MWLLATRLDPADIEHFCHQRILLDCALVEVKPREILPGVRGNPIIIDELIFKGREE